MLTQRLSELLELTALEHPSKGLIIYPPGNVEVEHCVTYPELLRRAQRNAKRLLQKQMTPPGSVILVHFRDHLDNIEWFWSVLIAGCVPAVSTPFNNHIDQRKKHISHLNTLLNGPLCITRHKLLSDFTGQETLTVCTVESIELDDNQLYKHCPNTSTIDVEDLAVLMLTSGSTGNAKAACLTNRQIFAAIKGKSKCFKTQSDDTFLNWIGLDHVANLTENHLHALYLGADQIHVQAADILQEPLTFLELLSKHKVAFSFAPNFFLAQVVRALNMITEDPKANIQRSQLDLAQLRVLTSGGEANVVATCSTLTSLLRTYGAKSGTVVYPGFGMTETCAGSIYNNECPQNDIAKRREFAAVGLCIAGIEMRISRPTKSRETDVFQIGDLELKGDIVTTGYYNNPTATASAFTRDGWFITGDQAYIDSSGQLNLVGRVKETMIVNGIKYSPHELEAAVEDACIPGVTPDYTIAFSYRLQSSPTEHICVANLPKYNVVDDAACATTNDTICKITMLQTDSRPYVLPLNHLLLQKSLLGKISRAKIRSAFERGELQTYQEINNKAINSSKLTRLEGPNGKYV